MMKKPKLDALRFRVAQAVTDANSFFAMVLHTQPATASSNQKEVASFVSGWLHGFNGTDLSRLGATLAVENAFNLLAFLSGYSIGIIRRVEEIEPQSQEEEPGGEG